MRDISGGAGLWGLVDCVGGPLVTGLFPARRQGAAVVAYGTLSPERSLVPNADLVYRSLPWLGFGIDAWSSSLAPAKAERMSVALWGGIASGRLPLPIRVCFTRADFAEGLRVTMAGGPGKVIVTPGWAGSDAGNQTKIAAISGMTPVRAA